MRTDITSQNSTYSKREVFPQWEVIGNAVADAFRMNEEERNRFLAKPLARLIAAIPFLAGCEDPERTAISHLGTYLLSVRIKGFANSKASDNEYLLKRLELINNHIGGDKEIIRRGMDLIALSMLSDYHRDIEEDRKLGKYNPVDYGAFNFAEERERLITEIEDIDCPDMERIMTIAQSTEQYWDT